MAIALGELAVKLRNMKDENGEALGYTADTLILPGNRPAAEIIAARWAEAIFTAHQTLENAQEFYADIKARARSVGRDPEGLKVLPGMSCSR